MKYLFYRSSSEDETLEVFLNEEDFENTVTMGLERYIQFSIKTSESHGYMQWAIIGKQKCGQVYLREPEENERICQCSMGHYHLIGNLRYEEHPSIEELNFEERKKIVLSPVTNNIGGADLLYYDDTVGFVDTPGDLGGADSNNNNKYSANYLYFDN